jgi:hypothetical protein
MIVARARHSVKKIGVLKYGKKQGTMGRTRA